MEHLFSDPVQLAGSGKVMINDTLLNFTGPTHDYGPIYRPINMQYDISSTAPDISVPNITISLASVVQIKCIKKYICWSIIDEAGKIEIMVNFPGSSGPVTCPFTMESEGNIKIMIYIYIYIYNETICPIDFVTFSELPKLTQYSKTRIYQTRFLRIHGVYRSVIKART